MDAVNKILKLQSFDDLCKAITTDMQSTDILAQRYGVRIIMLNNFHTFARLSCFLTGQGVKSEALEKLLDEDAPDTWLTPDDLCRSIERCKETSLITPFSELARFFTNDEFRGIFNQVLLTEQLNRPQRRIYIPLIGLQNRFTDFLRHFGRLEESAPIWQYYEEEQQVNVFLSRQAQYHLPQEMGIHQLCNLKEWLKFWKEGAPQEQVLCLSKPLYLYFERAKPDNIFNFHKIENAHEFIESFLGLSIPLSYHEEEESFWGRLLQLIDRYHGLSGFQQLVCRHFNVVYLDAETILQRWADKSTDSFDRWLMKAYLYTKNSISEHPYFYLCLNESENLEASSELLTKIAERIFFSSDLSAIEQRQYAEERQTLMQKYKDLFRTHVGKDKQIWIGEQLAELYRQTGQLELVLALCTNCFEREQFLLMGWYVAHKETGRVTLTTIEKKFPELAGYLRPHSPLHLTSKQLWATEYMDLYRQAKLADRLLPEIVNTMQSKNKDAASFYSWYHSFTPTHEALARIDQDKTLRPDMIYWIDGLGAEYFPYICYLVEQENCGMKMVYSELTRADIPSSTQHNRFMGDRVRHLLELDEMGHDKRQYKKYETLIAELNLLQKLLRSLLLEAQHRPCTIAIVSDHGLSALSRLVGSERCNKEAEHEGRFLQVEHPGNNDATYIFHRNEQDGRYYKVALTHASLGNKPTHEVHGGCTPEEVLVPFVVLSNKHATTPCHYQLTIENPRIPCSKPTVTIGIMPEPAKATLSIDGKDIDMRKSGTRWTATLPSPTEGMHKILISLPDGFTQIIEVEVYGLGFSAMGIDQEFDI